MGVCLFEGRLGFASLVLCGGGWGVGGVRVSWGWVVLSSGAILGICAGRMKALCFLKGRCAEETKPCGEKTTTPSLPWQPPKTPLYNLFAKCRDKHEEKST